MAIPYVKQTWVDGAAGGTPTSAARLGVIEQGIYDAHRMPCARVFNNAALATVSGTNLILTFNSERFDTDTIHDTVTNNSRLTCKTAGVYQISASVDWAANATGQRHVDLLLNATTMIAAVEADAAAGGRPTSQVVTALYSLAVNDYVEVRVLQNSTVGLNIAVSGNNSPEFMMVRVAS